MVVAQVPAHDWKSAGQAAVSACAGAAQPSRHERTSEAVRHPVTQVLKFAVALRAHAPRSSPHAPRQAAVDGSPAEVDDASHACTQLGWLLRQVVRSDRNVSVQPRLQEPMSAGAEFARQSIRQLDRVTRAVLRQAAVCAPHPAPHGWLVSRAVAARIAPRPITPQSTFQGSFMTPLFGSPTLPGEEQGPYRGTSRGSRPLETPTAMRPSGRAVTRGAGWRHPGAATMDLRPCQNATALRGGGTIGAGCHLDPATSSRGPRQEDPVIGSGHGEAYETPLGFARRAPYSARSAASTCSGCAAASLTRAQCLRTFPSGPIHTVERMTPTVFLPYIVFSP